MTNEELVRRYYGGDERALEELYRRNLGLIRRIARETAREFNCLHMDRERPGELSGYTKTILEDLCGEGALEFLTMAEGGWKIVCRARPPSRRSSRQYSPRRGTMCS